MTPDLLSVAVRAIGFAALFQAAGIGFFLARFGQDLTNAYPPTRRLGLIAAALGLLLILAHLALDSARMSGDFDGLLDKDMQRLSLESRSGASQLTQAAGLLIILLAMWPTKRTRTPWGLIGAVICIGGFMLTGHTHASVWRRLLAPLLALHLAIIAFWFGSLLPLAFVVSRESLATATRLINRFSMIAGRLVPLILLAGILMAWLLAGSYAVLRKPYGEILIAKTAGFLLLMLLASYNKFRLAPRLAQEMTRSALRSSMIAEFVVIVAVLSATAVLTTFYSPD